MKHAPYIGNGNRFVRPERVPQFVSAAHGAMSRIAPEEDRDVIEVATRIESGAQRLEVEIDHAIRTVTARPGERLRHGLAVADAESDDEPAASA